MDQAHLSSPRLFHFLFFLFLYIQEQSILQTVPNMIFSIWGHYAQWNLKWICFFSALEARPDRQELSGTLKSSILMTFPVHTCLAYKTTTRSFNSVLYWLCLFRHFQADALDLDAHCKRIHRQDPVLGIASADEGGNTWCFRGSERFVS